MFLLSVVATSQKKNMKRQDINDLREIWGTDGKVLEVLQQLVQVASHLSYAVRAPSHNDRELSQLDLLARDVVSSSDLFLSRVVSPCSPHQNSTCFIVKYFAVGSKNRAPVIGNRGSPEQVRYPPCPCGRTR